MKKKLDIPKNWTFQASEVADCFDAHVREQLPWYDLATSAMAHAARHFIQSGGKVLDLGASTGNVELALSDILNDRGAALLAVDNSEEMISHYRGRHKVCICDIEKFVFASEEYDLIVAFLSLMFVRPRMRARVIKQMKNAVTRGGGIIVFDKFLPAPGYIGVISMRLALAAKLDNGASADDIIAKELSLSGVQRPLSPAEMGEFVEYFRFGDFAGYVWSRDG